MTDKGAGERFRIAPGLTAEAIPGGIWIRPEPMIPWRKPPARVKRIASLFRVRQPARFGKAPMTKASSAA